jgi:hypothetical protein
LRRGKGCNKTFNKGRSNKICNSSSNTWQLESYVYEGVGIHFLQTCKMNSLKRAHWSTSAHDPFYMQGWEKIIKELQKQTKIKLLKISGIP